MQYVIKNKKGLFCGYRDKGNKKRLKQNFDLKVDKWRNRLTNENTYKWPNGQRDYTFILEILLCHMYNLNPFKKKNVITGYKHIPRQCNFPVMRMA